MSSTRAESSLALCHSVARFLREESAFLDGARGACHPQRLKPVIFAVAYGTAGRPCPYLIFVEKNQN